MTMNAASEIAIPNDVPDLAGTPRPADRVFFAAPPAEVGPLYRAESSLKLGRKQMSTVLRTIIILGAMAPGGLLLLLGFVAVVTNPRASDNLTLVLVGAVVALLGGLIAWYYTRFHVTCSYVGQLGAARYTLNGRLENKPQREFIAFERAAELRTSQTRHYYNGVYTGTSYQFRWTDAAGKMVLTLSGRHQGKNGLPKNGDPFHFANASEIAWSMFLLNRADAELAERGALTFRIDGKKAVIVGPGFIEFHFNGRQDRCEAGDIKAIKLNQGQFSIQHRDAKWYSSKGKFSFPYGNMANARLFLLVLDRFLPQSTWAQGH